MQGRQNDVTPISLPQELLDDLTSKLGEAASVEQLWGQPQKALSLKVDLKHSEGESLGGEKRDSEEQCLLKMVTTGGV